MSKPVEEKEKENTITNTNTNTNNNIKTTASPIEDIDIKKALTFLLSKEMKEYSLEKRKDFLLKKLPSNVVDKAFDLFQTVETSIKENIEELRKSQAHKPKEGFLSSLLDLGMLSTILLSSLGINYLLDLNRNKKNDIFYKEIEKKLNEEFTKNIKEMKNEINSQLLEFVPANTFKNEINSQIVEFTQQRGLSLNLSSKSLREDMLEIKKSVEITDKKLRETSVKIENNNLLLKQDILKDLENLIEENNKKILMKIIDNQNKLLAATSERFTSNTNVVKSIAEPSSSIDNRISSGTGVNIRSQIINKEPVLYEVQKPEIKYEEVIQDKTEVQNQNFDNSSKTELIEDSSVNISLLLETVMSSVEKDNDKFSLIKQLNNQLKRIYQMNSDKKEGPYYVNLTNKIFQKANAEKLKEFLIKSGFDVESNNKLVYNINRSNDLEKANLVIEEMDSKFEEK